MVRKLPYLNNCVVSGFFWSTVRPTSTPGTAFISPAFEADSMNENVFYLGRTLNTLSSSYRRGVQLTWQTKLWHAKHLFPSASSVAAVVSLRELVFMAEIITVE